MRLPDDPASLLRANVMSRLVIMSLEGVLQAEDGRAAETGLHLYRAHRNQPATHLVLISAAKDQVARQFLHEHKIPEPSQVISDAVDTDTWVRKCQEIRRTGPYPVDYVIVPHPGLAAELYYHGFCVLLYTSPQYARPEWRPDAPGLQAAEWSMFAADLKQDHHAA